MKKMKSQMARTKIYDLFSDDGLFGQTDAARDWLSVRDIFSTASDQNGTAPRYSAGQEDGPYLQDPMRAARGWGF